MRAGDRSVKRGGKVQALARTLHGRAQVAHILGGWQQRQVTGLSVRLVEINGSAGAPYLDAQQRLIAVVALDIGGGEIREISSITNPDKLIHLGPVGDVSRTRTSRSSWRGLPTSE